MNSPAPQPPAAPGGLLVERPLPIDLPQVVVSDTLRALTACARAHRRRFRNPVVAVTGSNGKTTTKEMIGAILSRKGPCLITKGNLNNHIGVPLTLLDLRQEHRHAVIEMGANHGGEIAHLASIAEPDIGLVTNAGAAHLEGFDSLDGVAAGKGELFAGLPSDGVAVINADDRYASSWRSAAAGRRLLTFGVEQPADFTAHHIVTSIESNGPRQQFDLVSPVGNRAESVSIWRGCTISGTRLARRRRRTPLERTSLISPLDWLRSDPSRDVSSSGEPSMARCSWTIRTMPTRHRSGPVSMRFARSRAPGGSCSAT